jgi:hypothetical protein
MKFVFIGASGSMGFKNGKTYELETHCTNNGIVIICHSLRVKCPYSSIESFLKNWKQIN